MPVNKLPVTLAQFFQCSEEYRASIMEQIFQAALL